MCRSADNAFANQLADRRPGESATLLRFRSSHLEHHVWRPCTNAQSVPPATLASKDASSAASFAAALGPVVHARTVTNRSLWLICSNQLSRPTLRRLANEPLSTGFVDRR